MARFHIRVADINVEMIARGELTERICRPYLIDNGRTDLRVYTTAAQIGVKQRAMPIRLTDEQAECICLHENLSLQLLPFDAFVLHAALISYRGRGYAFVAPRMGGKTTHAKLWRARFGDDVRLINGDKPIVRWQKDGTFAAYGTPWCGKEELGENAAVPLCGVCFLSKGSEDVAREVTEREYLHMLIRQVVFPPDRSLMDRSAKLLARFIRTVPAVAAECTMTEHAAETVLRALMKI